MRRFGDNRAQPNYYSLGWWATYAGILCLLGWAVTDLLG